MHKKHKISVINTVFDKSGNKEDKTKKPLKKVNEDEEEFFMLDIKEDPSWNFSSPIF